WRVSSAAPVIRAPRTQAPPGQLASTRQRSPSSEPPSQHLCPFTPQEGRLGAQNLSNCSISFASAFSVFSSTGSSTQAVTSAPPALNPSFTHATSLFCALSRTL